MSNPSITVEVNGIDNLSGFLKGIESKVIRFVGSVSAGIAALAAISLPIKESINFQTELLNAARTTKYTTSQVTVLKEGLRDLSTQVNVTAIDLAKIATLGGQMGLGEGDPTGLVAFTSTVSVAVSALGMGAEEVVNSFGKLVNVFNIPPDKFRNAMSALVAVSNASVASGKELFDVVRRIGNLGGSVDFPQAAALSASMIDLGLTAETAGTTLTKIFADFKAKAGDFAAIMQGPLSSVQGWIKLVSTDGIGALNAYADALNRMNVEDASAMKAKLTGQGRMFEAMSKMQAQRERELDFLRQSEEVVERIREIASNQLTVEEGTLEVLAGQVNVYREAAQAASVMARLNAKAKEAFTGGDTAEKSQAIILAGVSAQWTVFTNNLYKVAAAVGEVVLPPLTEALTSMGDALKDPANIDSLRRSAEGIIESIRMIGRAIDYLGSITQGAKGVSVDWGALLHFSALLIAFGLIKGLGVLFGILGSIVNQNIPLIGRFTAALFGTSVASRKAAADQAALATQAQRTGGLFNLLDKNSSLIRLATAIDTLRANHARLNNLVTQYSALLATANTRLQTAYGASALRGLRDISLLQQRVIALEAKRVAAAALGTATGNRSAGQYAGQIARLNAAIAELQAAQAAATQLENRVLRLNGAIGLVNNGIARLDIKARLAAMVADAKAGATAIANALSNAYAAGAAAAPFGGFYAKLRALVLAARVAGNQISLALENALAGGIRGIGPTYSSAVAAVKAGFNRVVSAAVAGGTAFKNALGNAFLAATAPGSISKGVGNLSRVVGGLTGIFDMLFRKIMVGSAAATVVFGASVKTWMLNLSGLTLQYETAQSAGTKFFYLTAAGANLLHKAITGLFGLLMRFLMIFFFATMIKDLLQAIGMWDGLARSISNVFRALGVTPPSFLNTEEEARAAAVQVEILKSRYEDAAKEAAKLTPIMRGVLLEMSKVNEAAKKLTFDPRKPGASGQNTNGAMDAVFAGFAMQASLLAAREVKERAVNAALTERKKLEQELTKGGVGTGLVLMQKLSGAEQAASAIDKVVANERKSLKLIDGEIKALSVSGTALTNVFANTFDQQEAIALFQKGLDGTKSKFAQMVDLRKEELDLERKLAAQGSPVLTEGSATGSLNDSGQKEATKAANIAVLTLELEKARNASKSFREETERSVGVSARLNKIFNSLDTAKSVQGLALVVRALNGVKTSFAGFKNNVEVKVVATGTEQAKLATFAISNAYSKMYSDLAAGAKAAAESAKLSAQQAMGEVEKIRKQTKDMIDSLGEAYANMKRKAANNTEDKKLDAESTKRLGKIGIEYDEEKRKIDEKYEKQKEIFGDVAWLRAAEKQDVIDLDAKYKVLNTAETERVSLIKAQREASQKQSEFDALISKVASYESAIVAANKKISDPTNSYDVITAAIATRAQAVEGMGIAYSNAESKAKEVLSLDAVGSKEPIGKEVLERMQKGLDAAGEAYQKAKIAGVNNIEGALTRQATHFSELAKQEAQAASLALQDLMLIWANVEGGAAVAADKTLRLLGDADLLKNTIGQIQERTRSGLIDPSTVNSKWLEAEKKNLIDMLSTIRESKVGMTQAGVELHTELMAAIFKEQPGDKVPEVGVQPIVTEAASKKLQEYLTTTVTDLKVVVTPEWKMPQPGDPLGGTVTEGGATVTVVPDVAKVPPPDMANALTNGKGSVDVEIRPYISQNFDWKAWMSPGRKARGGPIGEVSGFGSALPRFGGGGRVSGPGGGTSDSVLSWLSNGEFVMDALTTSMFGSKFFMGLQAAARGGFSGAFLQGLALPKFAGGGLNAPFSMPTFKAPEASSTASASMPRSSVDINLNVGGSRISLFGERQQATALIQALKRMEV